MCSETAKKAGFIRLLKFKWMLSEHAQAPKAGLGFWEFLKNIFPPSQQKNLVLTVDFAQAKCQPFVLLCLKIKMYLFTTLNIFFFLLIHNSKIKGGNFNLIFKMSINFRQEPTMENFSPKGYQGGNLGA